MENDDLLFDVADGIATVTINRPERRNALSVYVQNRLTDIWEELDARDDIRVAILTSADCGTFCAGLDLKEAAEVKAREGVDILTKFRDMPHAKMRACTKPIIAAMTGSVAAGGMLLSLNSDIRVGITGSRIGITEARIGRGSPWAMPLLWMIPQPLLMEMVLTGDWYPIEKFHDLGFVNYLCETPDEVRAKARSLAETIRDNAPLSVMAGKQSINTAMSAGCDAGLQLANRIYAPTYRSEDAIEGPKAFAEKRTPVWKGR